MKSESFRDFVRVATLLVLMFIGVYLFLLHSELQSFHARFVYPIFPPIQVQVISNDSLPLEMQQR